MALQMAKQQIARLPVQVPPNKHFTLDDIKLVPIENRGQALYAKLSIEGETSNQLHARLVKGEEERGGCTIISKGQKRKEGSEGYEWRLTCCFGHHDKIVLRAAASTAPCQLVTAGGAAEGMSCVASSNTDEDRQARGTVGKQRRRQKIASGQSIKVGCRFALSLRTSHAEPEVLLIRITEKEHVNVRRQPAHPERMCTALSDEAKDWVYGKLLAGAPARSIIDGMICCYSRAVHTSLQLPHYKG
jgi:hypothetical protein